MKKIFLLLSLGLSITAIAQNGRKITRSEYIDTYKELAIRAMENYKIPASITLAQGILESGNGNSSLARKANNHFGIKCHGWKGKSVKHDDDARNECFRKYKSVEESYKDHSEFLSERSRYAFLFEYKQDDYKAWAKGLKKAGYATSPTYSKALIKLIEENKLYEYDNKTLAKGHSGKGSKSSYAAITYAGGRKVAYSNRVKYVMAREGDNISSLSEELDMFQWLLPKYNDVSETYVFSEGEIVYIQPKRNKAETGKNIHIVKGDESLQSISQAYGIKLDKLASRNLLATDSVLQSGQQIQLRKKVKEGGVSISAPKIELKEDDVKEEFIIEFDADE